ncbi:MAG: flap endonuclease [Actinobacteria bacterium]|nr:flap endonuclease [Actinomycetota bacterium]
MRAHGNRPQAHGPGFGNPVLPRLLRAAHIDDRSGRPPEQRIARVLRRVGRAGHAEFRVQLWPAYKRHRLAEVSEAASEDELIEEVPDELGPQVDTLAELLDGLGISRVGVAGFEADDVIASVCARSDMPVDIVTSDRDLLQCVDDSRSVRLISIARGLRDPQVLDESAVLERYGVLPQQYVDFATLRGDPSDGLPGVPGVGEKTAAALIREYGSLTRLVEALAQPAEVAGATPTALKPAVRTRIAAVIETLDPMARVTTAVTDVPLPARWTEAAVLPAAPRREGLARCESAGVVRQFEALAAAGVVAR